MKSISLDDFLKAMDEDKSKSAKEFLEKLFNKPKTKEVNKEVNIEEVKKILHKEVDKLQTERDLRILCLKMGETVFDFFREVVIGKKEF